jgi:NAD(P)H-quinone oxidoreductase subunit 5
LVIRFSIPLVWALCAASAIGAAVGLGAPRVVFGPLAIDQLTLVLAAAVTLVSGVVHSFAVRYMDGDRRFEAFFGRLTGLTLVVLALLMADNLVLFAVAWVGMGWLLADLIGHVRRWPQARAAAALARKWFLIGSGMLTFALVLLGGTTGAWTVGGVVAQVGQGDPVILTIAALVLIIAAAIQCGLVPFHKWLLSSMTAPTPVSAFMHAGLVNAGGILLARFAPVFETMPALMLVVFLVGAASALLGAVAALVQTDIKRALASSTVAQMGFMVLQCGLGFFAAAMAHLVLHGLYKASLFLGAGSGLAAAKRPGPPETVGLGRIAGVALAAGAAGAVGFALASGKADGGLNSGAVLVLFAALAAGQAGATLARAPVFGPSTMIVAPIVLGAVGLVYGGLVRLAEALLGPVPGVVAPQELSPIHILAALAFVGIWGAVLAGRHRGAVGLYARLLTAVQPDPATITDRREAYHA